MFIPGVVEGEPVVGLVSAGIAPVATGLADEERAAVAQEGDCGVVLGEGREGGREGGRGENDEERGRMGGSEGGREGGREG